MYAANACTHVLRIGSTICNTVQPSAHVRLVRLGDLLTLTFLKKRVLCRVVAGAADTGPDRW